LRNVYDVVKGRPQLSDNRTPDELFDGLKNSKKIAEEMVK
jgi:hypothetical protein